MIEPKCMGDVWRSETGANGRPIGYKYRAQCLECQRLPRTPEDEDTGPWYNPKGQRGNYCNMQIKEKK